MSSRLAQGTSETEYESLLISNSSRVTDVTAALTGMNFGVHPAPLSSEAVTLASRFGADLLVVDCRSDELTALQLCRSLRALPETASVPLFVIADEAQSSLRGRAIQSGADDCLFGAPAPDEFLPRFHAVKQRLERLTNSMVLSYAGIELDKRKYKVWWQGRYIPLSMAQFRLIRFLLENPTVVFSREQLLEAVWGDPSLDKGTVTVALVRLRKAIQSVGGPNLIRRVRGVGYAIDEDCVTEMPQANPAGSLSNVTKP